ncbi:MAG: hypothetical protein KFF50_02470 [Desulfatitalea sp.]|nr:hypothetical protein [Desulfatitalea sp.]
MKNLHPSIFTLLLLFFLTVSGCGNAGKTADDQGHLKLASAAEWTERSDGLRGFQEHYGFEFPEIAVVDLGLAYQAVGTGLAHVGVGDATEGRIARYDLVVLADDRGFFPAYNPAPVARAEILETYPELIGIMKELSSRLDLATLVQLNKQVSIDKTMPQQVARDYLLAQGLIRQEPQSSGTTREPPVVVGGKTFTEALTLGYLTRYLLEDRGFKVIDEIGLGEVAVITPALFAGRIDIYWEYTGTGLMNVMGHDGVVSDPEKCWQLVRDWYRENHNVVWLDYAPANNTFVIFTSRELHEKHGWRTISDLAAHVNRKPQ